MTWVVPLYCPLIFAYEVMLVFSGRLSIRVAFGISSVRVTPYVDELTNPTVFTVLSHVGGGAGVGFFVVTTVCRDRSGHRGCCDILDGYGVVWAGIPILTGCPVIAGLTTSAMMRMMTTAATPYMMSFLSIALLKILNIFT